MIVLLSPAKNLNFDNQTITNIHSEPEFMEDSQKIMNKLQRLSKKELADLMSINEQLTELNYERFKQWHSPFTPDNALQAIFAFNGEVYNGLKARELSEEEVLFAQDHVRILSGLHGILRPLDLIQPYRLEMGTKLSIGRNKDLYDFWGNKLVNQIKSDINDNTIVNLASNEYFKAIDRNHNFRVITPVFKDLRKGEYKTVTIYMKKARGMMTRFMIKEKITNPEDLKHFEGDGYFLNVNMSSENEWVFTR
jgi:hypothetical protein